MKLIEFARSHRYELIAGLTGAAVMMLEIVGARLIAPYFGTSTYVWTAMIGVILGAMSLGFWIGGRLADRDNPRQGLSLIITMAALLVLFMVLVQQTVLELIAEPRLDLRLSAILAAVTLFGVPSMLIGMVSPHLAKIRITSLKTSGAAVGRLEAAGALGSIAGTFLSGYVLLAYFGARNLSIWLAILLLLTSFLAGWREFLKWRLILIAVSALLLLANPLPAGIISDTDTAYSRYQVKETTRGGRSLRMLLMDSRSIQSASYLDDPAEPVLPYIRAFLAATEGYGQPGTALIIGGGAHTLPVILQDRLPDLRIDLVEIDPALQDLSRQYFGFSKGPHTRLFYEDGRSFLNRLEARYDLIFADAYSSLTPPFQLSSREAVRLMGENLAEDGVVIANAVGDFQGGFLPSLERTYASVFPYVAVFQVSANQALDSRQNFIILAGWSEAALHRTASNLGETLRLPGGGIVFTDDYAPVERMIY